MQVINVHQRLLQASPEKVSDLLATLGSAEDRVWPRKGWPRMRLDAPLGPGASGGHGPIRYSVESWQPGKGARFRFTLPGVDGWHAFEILDATERLCVLEHRIEARIGGTMLLKWLLVVRALHDACVEDALSQVERSLGLEPRRVAWSPYVRFWMRWLSRRSGARAGRQAHGAL